MRLQEYEKEHLKTLRSLLPECAVLLKSNGDFPLKETGEIALYGNGVRKTIKGGTGSGEVNSRFFINVEEGFKRAGFTVTSGKWLDAYDERYVQAKADFKKVIKERAKKKHTVAAIEGMGAVMPEPEYSFPLDAKGDTAIYVLARISGEGNDRQIAGGDVLLSATEQRDILTLAEKYDKFMLVLNVGGPVDLSPVLCVENILVLSQLGVETGNALADIVTGKANPSGKLTTTWTTMADYPDFAEFAKEDDTRYNEGIYVGYRYFDTVGKNPLFPFGFGMSYTSFTCSEETICVTGEQVDVSAQVTNTGACSGKEVVQVYVSLPEKELDQPYQVLAGWTKTGELEAGASEKVRVSFALSQLASYDSSKGAYVLEAGEYVIRVGNSSRNTVAVAKVVLETDVIVKKVRPALGNPDFKDWIPEKKKNKEEQQELLTFSVLAEAFAMETVSYEDADMEGEIDAAVKNLGDEELALLSVGAFNSNGGVLSIIGNASMSVAGAAGESASVPGIPAMVMADGPAGLRLSQKFFKDEKGIHSLGVSMPESIMEFMPGIARFFMRKMSGKPKKGQEVYEQYATAIPIGTAIAQSWNTALAEACGDIVGDEMERFGVHLWLAPALNIHRSILCGRNFEYFSEDPLISGKFAAAITNGVQKHPGCGTTIKHYAANNQETNRYNNNSQVSERAMREIYLKGFGICVQESQPKAVMTSYNLLNGVHTSERRDLTEDILRKEFGFGGIVMTDWVTGGGFLSKNAKYQPPQAYKVAAAGGDLFMPGGKADYENVLSALKDGKLSREQAMINASRVCRMARELNR